MTNLQLAETFFAEVFGAVCFYNDEMDGYHTFSDKQKAIETLSVYFPNKIDENDLETKTRLIGAAGEQFYNRYCGAIGKKLCGMQASHLLVAYYLNSEVVAIIHYNGIGLKGSCNLIFDYFCGVDINSFADSAKRFTLSVETNNGLKIEKGANIQSVIESYLIQKDLLSNKNNQVFFKRSGKSEQEMLCFVNEIFGDENLRFARLAKDRKNRHTNLMALLSGKEWADFYCDMGINKN